MTVQARNSKAHGRLPAAHLRTGTGTNRDANRGPREERLVTKDTGRKGDTPCLGLGGASIKSRATAGGDSHKGKVVTPRHFGKSSKTENQVKLEWEGGGKKGKKARLKGQEKQGGNSYRRKKKEKLSTPVGQKRLG